MAFNDVEMAILAQASYKVSRRFEGESLHSVLTDPDMKKYLSESLGPGYSKHLTSLTNKVKGSGYTVVKTQDNTPSGFAAFAVKDPGNNVTVACRGTEMGELANDPKIALADIGEDVSLAFSKQTGQQKDMDAFMADLKTGGYGSYSFTGHSLGGNLAMYGAITTVSAGQVAQCTTYNAPGFNSDFLHDNASKIQSLKGKMLAYQNELDGVSPSFNVPGKVVVLECEGNDAEYYAEAMKMGMTCPLGVSTHLLDKLVPNADGSFKKNKSGMMQPTVLGLLLGTATTVSDIPLVIGQYIDKIFGKTEKESPTPNTEGIPVAATSVLATGGQRIQLTPAELKAQAKEMSSLAEEYNNLFDGVTAELNRVNGNWSVNLARNFSAKITSAQGKFRHVTEMLTTGANIAMLSANSFENTDAALAKMMVSGAEIHVSSSGRTHGGGGRRF